MHRLTAILLAASALSLVLLGLVLPATMAQGVRHVEASQEGISIEVFMSSSDAEDAPAERNFAGSGPVYAVVAYENATGAERFAVQLSDLSGLPVFERRVGPLSGSGRHSMAVGAADFVDSYKRRLQTNREALDEGMGLADEWCGVRPQVPDPWPPPQPTPGPGPTPHPDPYSGWAEEMLVVIEQSRASSMEITHTLQALMALPDMRTELPAVRDELAAAQQELINAHGRLAGMAQLLLPVPGRPDQPERPDPDTACQRIATAKTEVDSAISRIEAAVQSLPDDVSTWHLPPTLARYDGSTFVGCSQYKTDLKAMIGDQPRDTPAASVLWTVGDVGPPSLIFPAVDQAEAVTIGSLGRRLPAGAMDIYARSVTVPNANHEARLTAFVTDADCRPVTHTVSFWVAAAPKSGGATVDPSEREPVNGDADTTLTAGDDVTDLRYGGWVFACAGPGCEPRLPTPQPGRPASDQAWGAARFDVIGRAALTTTRLIVNPEQINRFKGETAGISVQVHDSNGRPVADNTAAKVWLGDGSPGVLAYDRQRMAGGRPVGDPERVSLGKSADLIVEDGHSRVPFSDDPGYQNDRRLYLYGPEDEPGGEVEMCFEVDGVQACTEAAVTIVGRREVYVPVVYKVHDVRATPTRRPTPSWTRSAQEPGTPVVIN